MTSENNTNNIDDVEAIDAADTRKAAMKRGAKRGLFAVLDWPALLQFKNPWKLH